MDGPLSDPLSTSSAGRSATATYDNRFLLVRERLERICTGLVGAEAAEDIVQDAYVRGRRAVGQLRDHGLFDAWITRLAINLCLNHQRTRRRVDTFLPFLARPEPRRADRDSGFRELVERLPSRERTLIVLHYGHGYSMEEIARMTGLPPSSVRSIVFRARRRLYSELGGERK